ncbi:branched-chain amino acid ABC transporter substrate-binding protein [Rhodovibrio sodomensis]|uniref:Branched-chain amino acid ABC transporter substrate-binding protein n=1 Tax=Rhodovibrio sodomensis TaxID=1088 RepID=A0ABS1DDP1_9PROT|nr:branched-chain amino acid ABC transporter substrate-binding protein [Rhodovibrio sodomensis]MBK1668535.1 branched-chain amino acid ABC transporter substrate-binding protein [Rhodovibrio sodomensis]
MLFSRLGRKLTAGALAVFGIWTAVAATAGSAAAQDTLEVPIVYVTRDGPPHIPLTLLEPVAEDLGVQGARLGLSDNATTGRFMGHAYELREVTVPEDGSLAKTLRPVLNDGARLIVADLRADDLLALAALDAASDALIVNARSYQDRLRTRACNANVLHAAPSNAMLTDALAQYLQRKRWTEVFLVVGRTDQDKRWAESFMRAAKRFRLNVVARKTWTFDYANRRDESGAAIAQEEVTRFTRGVDDYDVLVVADPADKFGEYLPHRTADPRPVAGTQGLRTTVWSRVHEQWGGTQLQNRFEEQAGRFMTPRDYTNWLAVRAIGEAVSRTETTAPAELKAFMRGNDFELQGYKGIKHTVRSWNNQLRHRILLAGPRILVSVSPQPGFLHERTELDTLGYDKPESRCGFD